MQYRQGDVLIMEWDAMPEGVKKREGVVVAEGEATGHAHKFDNALSVSLYDGPDGDMYARLMDVSWLVHEEHAAIEFRAGIYKIRLQREYTPRGIINVSD